MPTENLPSNTEIVCVPRELADRIQLRLNLAASAFKGVKPERNELRAILAKPTEHPKGEPTALAPSDVTDCRECGSKLLSWTTHNKNHSDVQQGRLRSNDVTCLLVLGCNECSETLAVVSADEFVARLNTSLECNV